MTQTSIPYAVERHGPPAFGTRLFGWTMLAVLAGFLINNVLNLGYGTPSLSDILKDGFSVGAAISLAVYVILIVAAFLFVRATPNQALRWDAHHIHQFNAYIVRSLFWCVLLVGLADAAIAFMRVEDILTATLGKDMARNFGRSAFVGPYIHVPLIVAGFIIGLFTRTLGFVWLALLIVVAELLIVVSRFVFSYEQAFMGDLVRYWYAALFLFASAYTLYDEGHVRVDVFFAAMAARTKGKVNAVGSILLGMSTCWSILIVGMSGKSAIINAPVMTFEVSQAGSAGMYVKYQMAIFIGLFAITMLVQFVSYFFSAVADKRDEPGRREIEPVSH